MPDDLSLLDQLEEWLESQVPTNLHDLPYRMLETMERVSNELFETLNINGAPSLSIPFPPFLEKEAPPPPPPPARALPVTLYRSSVRAIKEHPYMAGGMALAMTAGLGYGGYMLRTRARGGRRLGSKGVVEDGMLKEAIVLLAPSPSPPLLVPLAATLLKAGYIVVVAVPQVKEAESLERRLSGLEERSALRVLIYDPEDNNTFPPFQRSLLATLTLRYPAPGKYASSDPYNPSPSHVPHIHAFVSLYPLHTSAPSQPGALPALPTLLSPETIGTRKPTLITLYPAASVLPTPETFANQLVTLNHQLLGKNLAAASKARIVSVYVGNVVLPSLPAIISEPKSISRREQAKLELRNSAATTSKKVSVIKDYILGGFASVYRTILGRLGIGAAGRDYIQFERKFLRVLRSSRYTSDRYTIGQYSYLSLALSRFPLRAVPYLTHCLPALPSATGPTPPLPPQSLNTAKTEKVSTSASSSDHEGGEDLASSVHTGTSASSKTGEGYESSASGAGLDGSWVGLDSTN